MSLPVGFKHSEESKRKISKNNAKYWLGKKRGPHSEETKKKIRQYNHTKEAKEKIRKANLNKTFSKETREKIRLSKLGKKRPDMVGNKFCQGRKPWNTGTKGVVKANSGSFKKGCNVQRPKGWKHSEETKKKISENWNPECLRRRDKSSLEIKFENIVNKLGLPYRFVGNGEFLIGRKCPDFINTNGKKIAIEVYYSKHKERFRNGLEDWMFYRQLIFKKYGWEIQFFNEIEVNEDEIKGRLG